MSNLLRMEKYHLLHNRIYWFGLAGVFLIGFFTADTYVQDIINDVSGVTTISLSGIFDRMVYDSTFLLIIISCLLALILGQEFSNRTIALEITAGHSRKEIFISKVIVYLIFFNIMAVVYPIAGCLKEYGHFGISDVGNFLYHVGKDIFYSVLLNSATFLIAIWICFCLKNAAKSVAVTVAVVFVLSLYLGYGMMMKFPVGFLPTYQIRAAVSTIDFMLFPAVITGILWIGTLTILSWRNFRTSDLK